MWHRGGFKGKYFELKSMLSRRKESVTEIHVNPNRPKTPTARPQPLQDIGRRRSVSPSVQGDDYETQNEGSQSETMIFSREPTPKQPSYGTVTPVSENTPLLNERSYTQVSESMDDEETDFTEMRFFSRENLMKNKWTLLKHLKVGVLAIGTLICIVFIVINPEHEEEWKQVSIVPGNNVVPLEKVPVGIKGEKVTVTIKGPFDTGPPNETSSSNGSHQMSVFVGNKSLVNLTTSKDAVGSHTVRTINEHVEINSKQDVIINQTINMTIRYNDNKLSQLNENQFTSLCVPLEYSYTFTASSHNEEISALIVLLLVYLLIIFDLVHRTLAATLGSLAAVAVMSAFGFRPTLEKIMTWLDVETLSLLFGMMIIVAIFSETGFFDYCAFQAYKLAKGQVWPLITLLCVFSAVVSAFLDNVTTILLMTPVTIKLCEVLNLDPKKILIAEVLFSNIGGTATAIGDPPNVIIVSHHVIKETEIGFATFTAHMLVGIVFVAVAGYLWLRVFYRRIEDLENKDPPEITELQHEIDMWNRASKRMVAVSREEKIMHALFRQKVVELENQLVRQIYRLKRRKQKNFKEMSKELEEKHRITDKTLLIKSGAVLIVVILTFFLHSFITDVHIGLGWIAIMGAVILMILADMQELEIIIGKVEWTTLIFFAALFSLMEALNELGLIDWIGDGVKHILGEVHKDHRLVVAIVLITWVSALASSFIDNIPFTTAMIPVILAVHNDPSLRIELLPMILALAFGACLGGNGTLIGASANVVAAGIAEQHGYGFTFMDFLKVGFPMMLVTTAVSTVYLIICHIWGTWGNDIIAPLHS